MLADRNLISECSHLFYAVSIYRFYTYLTTHHHVKSRAAEGSLRGDHFKDILKVIFRLVLDPYPLVLLKQVTPQFAPIYGHVTPQPHKS